MIRRKRLRYPALIRFAVKLHVCALEHLIKDGRIQPGRIEEVVNKVRREIENNIMKVGEDTVFKLGIGKIDREIIKLIGRLEVSLLLWTERICSTAWKWPIWLE